MLKHKKYLWFMVITVGVVAVGTAYYYPAKKAPPKPIDINALRAEGTPIYHIEGIKDARLNVWYMLSYKTTNLAVPNCSYLDKNTNTRKAMIKEFSFPVQADETGNYRTDIPIIIKGDQGCQFQFIGLSAVMRRVNDDKYSRHTLLLDRPENTRTIYYGYKTGSSADGGDPETPYSYMTDKPYFQVAPQTSYRCRTRWSEDEVGKKGSGFERFYCVMKIDSGDTQFYWQKGNSVTNPQFGVDEIVDSQLTVNFIADDAGSIRYINDATQPRGFRKESGFTEKIKQK